MSADAWIDALESTDGRAILAELASIDLTAQNELRVLDRLRARYAPELVRAAVAQTQLRRRAQSKFSRAGAMLFTTAGLEQASSERMARHHAARYSGFDRITDLCCGIGGDLIGLAERHHVTAVDRDPVHARLARHNAIVNDAGARAAVVCADVVDVRLSAGDVVFIDPARRTEHRRLRGGESEPSLAWCVALAPRVAAVGIKSAPGIDTDLVPADWELEFVSEARELKESALWSPSLRSAARRATVLPEGQTITRREGANAPVRPPGSYLLDIDPAVTRAGLVDELAELLGACWKIDDRIGFLSADAPMDTPFGRSIRVEASMPWNLKRLNEALRSLDVGSADIRKRGSPVDVDELHRKLKLRGGRSALVVLTQAAGKPWAFVCTDAGVGAP
ncbi:MAG TPA: class I SAM-dependent methyltransferase [Gemmatimonadaceae bacterium]|nr:class I SAM-dependent methyltransferase [Gemmatimonadaceae bacterium]